MTLFASAQNAMPIIAYLGVPPTETFADAFRQLRECGFTVSLQDYASLADLQKACRVANEQGVQILGQCPEMHKAPERTAAALKNQPGFFGYNLCDEPSAFKMRQLQTEIRRIQQVDPQHVCYVNLLPYYDDEVLSATCTDTYAAYLDSAAYLSCQQISFDYYPVTRSGLRPTWSDNMEQIRQMSLRIHKPFWGFVLSVPHLVYPLPTMGSLRLQAYANLAYGAQAIQYFSYWTLGPEAGYNFHDAPIAPDGHQTITYSRVRRMNKELLPVADLFWQARVDTVWHDEQRIISQFEKSGHRYEALINLNYRRRMKLEDSDQQIHKLPPGGILIRQLD